MGPAESERLLAGRYRLRTVIGRGGMGVVWQARDELLGRDVAVKEIIWPAYMDAAEWDLARQRAQREAQMAARLNHPNVVGIYDVVAEDDRPWIIMELVPYRSLRDQVQADGPMTPAQAAHVGLGILAALQAAHKVGVLHRDVKPANVLIAPEGRVVLTDFGIARATDSPVLTGTGVLVGSPSYISPERARGSRASAAADLWGLGACLYAAVEGRPPFDREGALASLTAVVTEDPDPSANAGPLWPVISGLLRKDPDERLSAAEAEGTLQDIAKGDAPSALGTTPETMPSAAGSPEAALVAGAIGVAEGSGLKAPDAPEAGRSGAASGVDTTEVDAAGAEAAGADGARADRAEVEAGVAGAAAAGAAEADEGETGAPEGSEPHRVREVLADGEALGNAEALGDREVGDREALGDHDMAKDRDAAGGGEVGADGAAEEPKVSGGREAAAGDEPTAAREVGLAEPVGAPEVGAAEPAGAPEVGAAAAAGVGAAGVGEVGPNVGPTNVGSAAPSTGPLPAASDTGAGPGRPLGRPDVALPAAALPGAGGSGRHQGQERRRILFAAAAAAAVVVVAAVVVSLVLTSNRSAGQHQAAPPAASHSASASARPSAAPSATPSATPSGASSASRSGASSASPSATPSASGGSSAVPAGYQRFTNSTGFSIGVPDGWQVSHVGHYVYVRDPADSGIFLLIDQSDQPQPNALADWKQQAAARQGSYPGYHLVRLQSVSYPQAEQAADWEFTYDRDGIPVHILNRNVLANATHAYALYWSTPASDWSADYHYFQAFAATFRPAGVNQG